jgi:hypothetical protein
VSELEDNGLDRLGLDDALLADLQLAGRLDEMPSEMVAAAKAGFVWRTMDAELAELVADSAEDDMSLAGVRGAPTVRMLTFQSPTLTVEVEALATGSSRRLVGQLVPPQAGRLEVRHGGVTMTVAADALGRFSVDHIVPGPVSLYCSGVAGGAAVSTDWVVL